jgi:hypothetical protein
MPYKQPKNTPLHNDGASEPITAAILGGIKLAKVAVAGVKAAKAAKVAAAAAKAAKAAKAGKVALKAGKFAKTAKAASTAAKTGKATASTAKATTKGAVKLTQNTMPKLQKLGQAGQKSVTKAQKFAKFSSKHQKLGKAVEKTKSLTGKAKGMSDYGFDKAAEITGKDAGDLKSRVSEIGINKANEAEAAIRSKNDSSITAEDLNQPLGLTKSETEPLDPRYETKDQPSSYSNPSGASMRVNMPKGYKSSSADNFKTPKTDYQRFFQNLANNSVNANIGGVKVNVGHVGLIAGHLVGKGVDAVKAKKRLNSLKKEKIANNESVARAEEEKKNKKIMQDIDNRENNIVNKTFNKK